MTGRIVALDIGSVRTGVALSDGLGLTAQPLGFVLMKADWLEALRALLSPYSVGQLIVGLPRHLSGDEGESALRAREKGREAGELLGLEPVFIDERMTSVVANRVLLEADLSRGKRKSKVDALAAALILQNYLDGQRS